MIRGDDMASYVMPYTKTPPCRDCLARELNCHSHCEKYIEWKVEHQERKKTIDKKFKDERDYRSLKFERKYQERKRKNGKK